MVSLDTPSHPDSPMGAAGARHNDQSPSGMRTTYQSMNQDQGDKELCIPVCLESEPHRCHNGAVSRCPDSYSSPWVESITREAS